MYAVRPREVGFSLDEGIRAGGTGGLTDPLPRHTLPLGEFLRQSPTEDFKQMPKLLSTTALALLATIAFSTPAPAAPIQGSFGFGPSGTVLSNNGVLNSATMSTTYQAAKVHNPGIGVMSDIYLNETVALDPLTFTYAPGLGTGPSVIDVSVGDWEFLFGTVQMTARGNGFIAAYWTGVVVQDASGQLGNDATATLTQSCDQVYPNGLINCSNTTVAVSDGIKISEPNSAMLLAGGIGMLGVAGAVRHRRRNK